MAQSILREARSPRISWVFIMAAVAACTLGFALTYTWIRERGMSAEPAVSLTRAGNGREQDGLSGPVNRVRTEVAKLSSKAGKLTEGPRELMESTTYDQQGNRVESDYYFVSSSSSQVGREDYAYDERGNIAELTLRDNQNSILGREAYTYEYDAQGNWTRMVTSSVVESRGKLVRQPKEVTYRNITYYSDKNIADMTEPQGGQADAPATQEVQEKFASLRDALDEWVAATNSRDLDKLMSFYDARLDTFYLARNVSRESVRSEKARLFKRADLLDIRASTPEITINRTDDTAVMYFRKQYVMTGNGQERSGEVLQQLRWRRAGDGWRIVGERDAQVIRRSPT